MICVIVARRLSVVIGRPLALGVAVPPGLVEPVDHHDAEPVEQGGDRQQQRVGVRRPAADREVRAEDDHHERDHVLDEGREVLALEAERHVGERERDDAAREQHHPQLGGPAAGGSPPPAAGCPAPERAWSCCSRGRLRGRGRLGRGPGGWLVVGLGGGVGRRRPWRRRRPGRLSRRPGADAERRGRGAVGRVGRVRLRAGVVARRDLDLALGLGARPPARPGSVAFLVCQAATACHCCWHWLTWPGSWSMSCWASVTLPCEIVWAERGLVAAAQLADLQGRPLDEAGQADAGQVLVGAAEDGDVAVLHADVVLALVVPPEAVRRRRRAAAPAAPARPSRSATGACRGRAVVVVLVVAASWPGGRRAAGAGRRPPASSGSLVRPGKPSAGSKAAVSLTRSGPGPGRPLGPARSAPGSNALVSNVPV